MYNWKEQLDIGDDGERLFLNTYEGAKKSEDRKYDFSIGDTTIELKTDNWWMKDTPNFFMEEFGNEEKQALGGPWRAVRDGIDFFVYLFIKDGVFFWFDPKRLKRLLEMRKKDMKVKRIWNHGYNATGYLVDRNSIKHLVIQEDKIEFGNN